MEPDSEISMSELGSSSEVTDARPNRSTKRLDLVLNEIRKLGKRLKCVEEQNIRIENALNKLTSFSPHAVRSGTVQPAGLPFDSVAAIMNFEKAADEEYDDLVNYCVWLAGSNPCECANLYMKNVLTDRLSDFITWTGSRDMTALRGTRLVKAFEEAMNINRKFPKVNRTELNKAMKRALHSAKERIRKSRVAAVRRHANQEHESDEETTIMKTYFCNKA